MRHREPGEYADPKPVPADFDKQQKVMKMYCENADTYIKLSSAALALTLTFAHQILHVPASDNIVNGWMIAMWLCFLIAIVTDAFYQYLAVKYLERQLKWEYAKIWNWFSAGSIYGIMLASFYGGTIIFTVYAINGLARTGAVKH